jgi:transcriptional regulator with XRE-family HTH domain
MTLGHILKTSRQRADLSLREVERKTGISNGYLSLLESDAIKSPSPKYLHALAEVYGSSYSLLMELAGYVAPKERPATLPDGLSDEMNGLSVEEQSQVRSFVGYLKASRPHRP